MRWLFILLFLVPIVSASNESFVQLKEELHQPYESGESFHLFFPGRGSFGNLYLGLIVQFICSIDIVLRCFNRVFSEK